MIVVVCDSFSVWVVDAVLNVSQFDMMTSYNYFFSFTALETYLTMTAASFFEITAIYGYLDSKLFNAHESADIFL